MIGQFVGAFVRSVLVMLLVVSPALVMPPADPDEQMFFSVVALFAAFFVFSEYASRAPALIGFRFAPPVNRHRFALLVTGLGAGIAAFAGETRLSTVTELFNSLGLLMALLLDFPGSPYRAMLAAVPQYNTLDSGFAFAAALGASCFMVMLGMTLLGVRYTLMRWPPRHEVFNLWLNFPTFDATGGAGIAHRLVARARVNLLLAFAMPFLFPIFIRYALQVADVTEPLSAATLIWIAALWSLLPANFAIRAVAYHRIASLIRDQRLRRQTRYGPDTELSGAYS